MQTPQVVDGMRSPGIYPALDPRAGIAQTMPAVPEYAPEAKEGLVLWRSKASAYRVSLGRSYKALNPGGELEQISGVVVQFQDGWYQAPLRRELDAGKTMDVDAALAKCSGARVGGDMWRYSEELAMRSAQRHEQMRTYAQEHPEEFQAVAEQVFGPGKGQDFASQLPPKVERAPKVEKTSK
jgi:hypothetical protein